jgi:hypothetical protein
VITTPRRHGWHQTTLEWQIPKPADTETFIRGAAARFKLDLRRAITAARAKP